MTALQRVTDFFAATFGGSPDIVARGPGRVNLIGEHTDYNEGFALPFAIDRSTLAAVRLRPDRRIRVATDFTRGVVESDLDALGRATDRSWAGYPLGVVWALGEVADLHQVRGFDAAFSSDVPVGAGLSSSAAIESAIAVALNSLWGLDLDRRSLARVGQRAENVVVGAPTGILDQSASLLGEPDAAVLLDCRSLDTQIIPLQFDQAGLSILVVDTKVSHAHADGGYGARRASCEEAAATLGVAALRDIEETDLEHAAAMLDPFTFRRVRHVVTENQRVLDSVAVLRERGARALGTILLASHASMRDDFQISTPELDLAVETSLSAGAIGSRMTGGGFGGSAITLVDSGRLDQVADAVREAFLRAGFQEPDLITVRATSGACEIENPEV